MPFQMDIFDQASLFFHKEVVNDELVEEEAGASVVSVRANPEGDGAQIVTGDDDDADNDDDGGEGEDEAEDDDDIPASRGRPARSATPAQTPLSGRKRKAAETGADRADATPTRSRRGAPRKVLSARLAAKEAAKRGRGRPKGSTTKPNGAKSAGRRGRPRKDDDRQGEYEVEEILDSVIDADTLEHMYQVKWKGYPLSEATWEPRRNLDHAADLVRAFDAKRPRRQRKQDDAEPPKERKKPGRKPKTAAAAA